MATPSRTITRVDISVAFLPHTDVAVSEILFEVIGVFGGIWAGATSRSQNRIRFSGCLLLAIAFHENVLASKYTVYSNQRILSNLYMCYYFKDNLKLMQKRIIVKFEMVITNSMFLYHTNGRVQNGSSISLANELTAR